MNYITPSMLSNHAHKNDPAYITHVFNTIVNTYQRDLIPSNHVHFLSHLAKKMNIEPTVCYDIGSCVLHWTKHAKIIWPNTKIILFDAFEPASFLYKDYDHHIGLLTEKDNTPLCFYQNDLLPAGSSYYKEYDNNVFPVDCYLNKIGMSLDTIVSQKKFPLPDLIKLDVQGAELDIFKGAVNTLQHAKIIIVELQNVQYNLGAPLANQTIDYLRTIGFECIAHKFSDNGPDADYCFINKKLVS